MNESARAAHIVRHGMLPFRMISIDVNFTSLELCYKCIEPSADSFAIVKRCENLSSLLLGDEIVHALVPVISTEDENHQLTLYNQLRSSDHQLSLRQLPGLVVAQRSTIGSLLAIIVYILLFLLFFCFYFFFRKRRKSLELYHSNLVKSPLKIFTDEVLGYGSQGTVVFRGVVCERTVAVKRIVLPPGNCPEMRLIENEISLLQSSDHHPNVIRYFYHEVRDSFMYIALELCNCSLLDLLNDGLNETPFAEPKLSAITIEMVKGLFEGIEYLHTTLRIVHRDIKPSNVLLPSAGNRLVLADFGIGKMMASEGFSNGYAMRTICGTSGWRAPELILSEHGNVNANVNISPFASDVFSAGLVLFYILTNGMHPFSVNDTIVDNPKPFALVNAANETEVTKIADDPVHVDDKRTMNDIDPDSESYIFNYEHEDVGSTNDHGNDTTFTFDKTTSIHAFFEGQFERLTPALVEAAILRSTPDLEPLGKLPAPFFFSVAEAADLIQRMLQKVPKRRPTMAQVLGHPFFWTSAQKLDFLCDLSDCLSIEGINDDQLPREALVRSLSVAWRQSAGYYPVVDATTIGPLGVEKVIAPLSTWTSTLAHDWLQPLSTAVRTSILSDKRRRYTGSRVTDLLRAIRNRRSHFVELDVAQRAELGAPPDSFYHYWAIRFPFLVMSCWSALFHSGLLDRSRERNLRTYYLPWLGSL